MHSERVVVITDIHGCLNECKRLLEKLEFDKSCDRLINLGDTIDRGPQIYEVFEFLRALKEEMGDRCVLIKGNHECFDQGQSRADDAGCDKGFRRQEDL